MVWRYGLAGLSNKYLEANGRPERVDLRSYEAQGIDQIPTVHMGPADTAMERRGIQTDIEISTEKSERPTHHAVHQEDYR
jgi:hypothetical protein